MSNWSFDPAVIELAVYAHVRHVHTRYDELLASGWERHEAREAIAVEVQSVLEQWSSCSSLLVEPSQKFITGGV
jgi:hypothetical protein